MTRLSEKFGMNQRRGKIDTGVVQKLRARDENATSRVLHPLGRINRFPAIRPTLTYHTYAAAIRSAKPRK